MKKIIIEVETEKDYIACKKYLEDKKFKVKYKEIKK